MGDVGILNVGAGDTKLVFDKNNPVEMARASRIVKDMIRRGYVLFVEVTEGEQKVMRRALDFDEQHAEYIIADFELKDQENAEAPLGAAPEPRPARKPTKRVDATTTTAVSVARTAGG